ncbi:MAG: hypothetical protein WA919_29955 [Coleofasciculaceae cyanobacterium]
MTVPFPGIPRSLFPAITITIFAFQLDALFYLGYLESEIVKRRHLILAAFFAHI